MTTQIIDVSGWSEPPLQTEGTRDKSVLLSPDDGCMYYFKSSMKKGKKDYRFEFWSEVVASKIGLALDFNVADYNVGVRTSSSGELTIGALVKSVNNEDEDLVSGYNLLVQCDPDFSSSFKERHTLDLIHRSLEFHGLKTYFDEILKCMLFDAIIGNTDRHSENWAFIIKKEYQEVKDALLKNTPNSWSCSQKEQSIISLFDFLFKQSSNRIFMRPSPLYDNGSSLGREIEEERLKNFNADDKWVKSYIQKGKPDIRVQDKKMSFLETIECLCDDYPSQMYEAIINLKKRYNREQIIKIISDIDQVADINKIPTEFRLSQERKKFMCSIITERIERIIKIGDNLCVK